MQPYHSLLWTQNNTLQLLDQRLLPQEIVYLSLVDYHDVAQAIKDMVVRGAPAIGAAAAYGCALAVYQNPTQNIKELFQELDQAFHVLAVSRPTAVNLHWALERIKQKVQETAPNTADELRYCILSEAHKIAEEDIQANKQIGLNALPLIPQNAKIIHHCNTGALATVDYGTALGIIRTAYEHGKNIHVFLDETRPRFQGAKLSAWELNQLGVPHTVIVDGASGIIMRKIGIDLCLVGADRIASNGDTANKIGTYNLAVVAKENNVPLYVVAPTSTIDLNILHGDDIPIEERPEEEITIVNNERIVPIGSAALNLAFDVTPAQYITGIITEAGIAYPPFSENLPALVNKKQAK